MMPNIKDISIDLEDSLINKEINEKTPYIDINIEKGDITKIDVDIVVNAAHSDLTGGGGVDGAIHNGAGSKLLEECLNLYGCLEGECRITSAYDLPAKYIIHTVGPIWNQDKNKQKEAEEVLKRCYMSCLEMAEMQGLKSIAFPCISTGAYCFPKKRAAEIALDTIKLYFNNIVNSYIDIVYIICFTDEDVEIYRNLIE